MIEHRLIERMLKAIQDILKRIEETQAIDPVHVDTVVDFIRTYADRTHHGKEEEILFEAMKEKLLSEEDRRFMNELIEEHVFGRRTTKALVHANTRYRNGDEAALSEIVERLHTLIEFYPTHIEKEDKVFFPASRGYFTEEEDHAMLARFREFDGKMIHEKYENVVKELTSE